MKVPTEPAMRPCHKTGCKICTVLWKGFTVVKFLSVMTNKHAKNHDAIAL